MTLNTQTQIHADAIIRDVYDGLSNRGAVQTYIQRDVHTSDFLLPDKLVMRVKEEKDNVYYHIFREG